MGLRGLPAPSIRPLLLTGSGLRPSNKVLQRGFRTLLWERDVVSRTSLAHITNLQPSRGDSAHTANPGEVLVSNRTTQRRKPQKAPEIRKEWTRAKNTRTTRREGRIQELSSPGVSPLSEQFWGLVGLHLGPVNLMYDRPVLLAYHIYTKLHLKKCWGWNSES